MIRLLMQLEPRFEEKKTILVDELDEVVGARVRERELEQLTLVLGAHGRERRRLRLRSEERHLEIELQQRTHRVKGRRLVIFAPLARVEQRRWSCPNHDYHSAAGGWSGVPVKLIASLDIASSERPDKISELEI